MTIKQFFKRYLFNMKAVIIIGVFAGCAGAFYTARTYHSPNVPTTDTKTKTRNKKATGKDNEIKNIKTESHNQTSTSEINAINSNVAVGITGTVTQNIYKEPKPVSLRKRLIACLQKMDDSVLPELKKGQTKFRGSFPQHQVSELQSLITKDVSQKYIEPLQFDNEIVVLQDATYTTIHIVLKPTLIK